MTLNFYLSAQLMLDPGFHKLPFVKNFERDDKFGFNLSCEVHMSKLATTHWSTDLEIVYRPLGWIKFLNSASLTDVRFLFL